MIRRLLLKVIESKIYENVVLKVIPYIRFTMYYTSFRGWKYHRGYKILKPGDIILTRDKWKLTTLLIPGGWSHAALCVNKDSEFEVAEMTHRHYTKSTFFDICRESTRVVIMRCTDWDENYVNSVISKCLSFENAKYDVKFEYGIKSLYCSELVVASDVEGRLKYDDSDFAGLGVSYVAPEDLYEAKNVKIVWDSGDEKV